ncbi:MAG TPA: helix-turn-helix domain-containing protein [Gammaproteobacteria bacterium]|nr:helix-turn-helix domain-containing protein [Gammaproteobacteria bacterium]
MNITRTELGSTLRRLRLARGLTLADIAYAAGTDPANISRLERGMQGYSDQLLTAIADTFGMRMWELFKEAEGRHAHQVREDHGTYGAVPAKQLQLLDQRYAHASPAARRLIDRLVKIAASGKLSDQAAASLLTLLHGLSKTAEKKSKSKRVKRKPR